MAAAISVRLDLNAAEADQLKQAVENMHGGTATFAQSVPVKETWEGQTVWEGVVHVCSTSLGSLSACLKSPHRQKSSTAEDRFLIRLRAFKLRGGDGSICPEPAIHNPRFGPGIQACATRKFSISQADLYVSELAV
jgi:hypothetical protein